MGKYSEFKGKFVGFTEEPNYQFTVNERKTEIDDKLNKEEKRLNIKSYGDVLLRARIEKARLEKLVKDQNLTIAAMTQVMVDQLEDQTMTKVSLDNGVSMSIKDDVYVNVSDRMKFLTWISETSQEDLLSVNYQTMASLVKRRLTGVVAIADGEEALPPGINAYFKQGIMVRGAKNLGLTDED